MFIAHCIHFNMQHLKNYYYSAKLVLLSIYQIAVNDSILSINQLISALLDDIICYK